MIVSANDSRASKDDSGGQPDSTNDPAYPKDHIDQVRKHDHKKIFGMRINLEDTKALLILLIGFLAWFGGVFALIFWIVPEVFNFFSDTLSLGGELSITMIFIISSAIGGWFTFKFLQDTASLSYRTETKRKSGASDESSADTNLVGEDIDRRLREHESIIYELRRKIKKETISKLESDINVIASEVATRAIEEIPKRLSDESVRFKILSDADTQKQETLYRISSEIESLTTRGNFNLSIGLTLTLIGVAILGIAAFDQFLLTNDTTTYMYEFAPKLALSIVIQIFAYFFLSLYRASLTEKKYYQNEITNIESMYYGLMFAVYNNSDDALKEAVSAYLSVERNHVLKKGQSTVEIERHRMAAELLKDLREAQQGFVKEMVRKK